MQQIANPIKSQNSRPLHHYIKNVEFQRVFLLEHFESPSLHFS